MPFVETTIVIEAPAREVYELAKNQERFPEFMPDVESVVILEREPHRMISRWKTLVEDAPIEWTEEDLFDDIALRVDYKLLEGDLDTFEGSWTFEETDGQTFVTLGVDDAGRPQARSGARSTRRRRLAGSARALVGGDGFDHDAARLRGIERLRGHLERVTQKRGDAGFAQRFGTLEDNVSDAFAVAFEKLVRIGEFDGVHQE
jgi:ribosome-associated toxin RatA of RatAB toxin-antitoxin module